MGRRVFDVAASLLGILITSPLWILAALAIVLTSHGPVFFRQERMGRHFQPFRIVKFRTMSDGTDVAPLTARGDQRVTMVGRFLRLTKIDELPQLLNVLTGEMSIVGPRPELSQFVELFRSDYEELLQVRPGITDEASIAFRHEDAILATSTDPQKLYRESILPQKIAMSKQYQKRRTLARDLWVILRTLARL